MKNSANVVRTASFWGLLLLCLVVLCEVVLKIAATASPHVAYVLKPSWDRERIPDARLGHRLSPYYPGHDRTGYRNEEVPQSVSVLAIGDSYTYGYAATPDSSWPRQLERLMGQSVYNGGVPGYGACEYRLVLNELLRLKPKSVVLAIHTGNDLSDVYQAVYEQNRCAAFRAEDQRLVSELNRLDRDSTLQELAVARGGDVKRQRVAPRGLLPKLNYLVTYHSGLYGLIRELRFQLQLHRQGDVDTFAEDSAKPHRIVYAGPRPPRTVFKDPSMFELAVDLEDPRIREGLRLTEALVLDMERQLEARGVELVVLIIMDKPRTYAPLLAGPVRTVPDEFFKLASLETDVAEEMSEFLEQHDIPTANVAAALTHSLAEGIAVYPESDDHHNNAKGYEVIAEIAADQLKLAH